MYVVDLSVLKFINKIQIKPPAGVNNNSYVGNMIWVSPIDLSVTFTNREQTSALTILCRAPTFICRDVCGFFFLYFFLFKITVILFYFIIKDSYRIHYRQWLGITG